MFVLAPPNTTAANNPALELDDSVLLKSELRPEEGFWYAGSLGEGAGYWITMQPMDVALSDLGLEPLDDDEFLVFGGVDANNEVVASVFLGHNVMQTYEALPDMPEARYRHAHARLDGRLYVIGGLNSTEWTAKPKGDVLVFDEQAQAWGRLGA